MQPISPVIPGLEQFEVNVGEGQPEFIAVPTLIGPGPQYIYTSRWELTDDERAQIAAGATIYYSQYTGGERMRPMTLSVGAGLTESSELTSALFEIFQPEIVEQSVNKVLADLDK